MTVGSDVPVSDIDLFTDEALREPWAAYAELRALGPVVHLPHYGVYAVTQYAAVREVSHAWEKFSSARGVGLNDVFNKASEGVMICSDPPDHRTMREVLERPLLPDALKEIESLLRVEARNIVEALVSRGQFDAATELGQHLPLTVVSRLVGLGEHGRQQMLEWGAATFDALGPDNHRTHAALPKAQEMIGFAMNNAVPGTIDPSGWAAALYNSAAEGELPPDKCPFMVMDYIAPSLDTTILGTASIIHLFATHPDQWALLRQTPSLVRHAINEALRLASPLQRFTRVATEDCTLEGVYIPAGQRMMLLFGSANRDEQKYPNPDVFDITRKPSDHLAFGTGEHACVGMNLARLEIRSLLEELLPRVERFELLSTEHFESNSLYGFSKVEVKAVPVA